MHTPVFVYGLPHLSSSRQPWPFDPITSWRPAIRRDPCLCAALPCDRKMNTPFGTRQKSPHLIWLCLHGKPLWGKLSTHCIWFSQVTRKSQLGYYFLFLFDGGRFPQAASSVSFPDGLHFPKCLFNNFKGIVPELDELTFKCTNTPVKLSILT